MYVLLRTGTPSGWFARSSATFIINPIARIDQNYHNLKREKYSAKSNWGISTKIVI